MVTFFDGIEHRIDTLLAYGLELEPEQEALVFNPEQSTQRALMTAVAVPDLSALRTHAGQDLGHPWTLTYGEGDLRHLYVPALVFPRQGETPEELIPAEQRRAMDGSTLYRFDFLPWLGGDIECVFDRFWRDYTLPQDVTPVRPWAAMPLADEQLMEVSEATTQALGGTNYQEIYLWWTYRNAELDRWQDFLNCQRADLDRMKINDPSDLVTKAKALNKISEEQAIVDMLTLNKQALDVTLPFDRDSGDPIFDHGAWFIEWSEELQSSWVRLEESCKRAQEVLIYALDEDQRRTERWYTPWFS